MASLIKKSRARKSMKACKSGWYKNSVNKRCRKYGVKDRSVSRRSGCKSGWYKNPVTKRCRKSGAKSRSRSRKQKSPSRKSRKSSRARKPCKSNQVRNRSTKRCRNKSPSKKSRKPCKSNQVRNRSTKRCRNKSSSRKSSKKSPKRKSVSRKSRARKSSNKSPKRKSVSRKSVSRKSVSRKSRVRKSPKKSPKRKSVSRKSLVRKSPTPMKSSTAKKSPTPRKSPTSSNKIHESIQYSYEELMEGLNELGKELVKIKNENDEDYWQQALEEFIEKLQIINEERLDTQTPPKRKEELRKVMDKGIQILQQNRKKYTFKEFNEELGNAKLRKVDENKKNYKNGVYMNDENWKFDRGKKNREIPCESFMGKSSCENEYGEIYENVKLRRCRWNQSNPRNQLCQTLEGDKLERLRITLGLSKQEFAVRNRSIEEKNKEIYNEITKLRKLNKYIPNLEQVKKQVIKNKQENNKVMTANIKQVLEDSKQVTKEIEKKENSPQVKEELKNVNQDLATLAESTQKLANISSKKDEQTLKVMTLEDMLIKKQTGQDSNELGQKFIDSCDNCYKILKKYDLDCPEKCDYDTAKKALNKLYLKYHPDRGGDPKIFREIRECGPMVVQDKCKNTNTGRKTSVDQNVVKELKQEIQEQKLDVKNLEVILIKSQKTGPKTSEDQKVVKELKQEIKQQKIDVKNLEAMLKSKQKTGPKTSGQQMNLDAMLKNKQQKGPKTSDELKIEKELKQEIKELVSINTEVKNVTKVVDNNRKNLLADIQNLKSKVTSKETKTIIADISSDVKNICKGAKKWSASLNSCVCKNEDEIENEDGICFNKKIVEKSTWYQEKGDDSQNVMDWIKDGNWFEDD